MKKTLASFVALALAASALADPIQLVPLPPPAPLQPKTVHMAPVTLTPAQAAQLLTAIAGTGLMVLPSGYSMTAISDVQIHPILSGSSAGGVKLFIVLSGTN